MIRNIVSVCALLALLVSSFIAIGSQGVPWFAATDNRRHATLLVRDAGGLTHRSPILLRGVPIGEVASIQSNAQDVAVEFWYTNNFRVPVNSTFRVENLSALGETYLSIKPSPDDSGPALEDHQRLVADAGTVPGTIGEMAVAVIGLLRDLDPQRFNRIIDELDTGLSDTVALPRLAAASTQINNAVKDNRTEIRNILGQLQTILSRQGEVAPSLGELPESLAQTSVSFQKLVEKAVTLAYESSGKYPDDLRDGALPVLGRIAQFEDDIGTNVYNLTEPLLPPMQATAAAMATIDTSRLLDATMDSLETPGAFTVHVVPGQ